MKRALVTLLCLGMLSACTVDSVELRRNNGADAASPADAQVDGRADANLGRCLCLRTCTIHDECRDIGAGVCGAGGVCTDDAPNECVTSASCGAARDCLRENDPSFACE